MPVLNGLEATEEIVDKYRRLLSIILSVQGESEYLKKAMFLEPRNILSSL